MSPDTLALAMLGGFGLALPVLLWLVAGMYSWVEAAELFGFVIVCCIATYGLLVGLLAVT